MIECVNCHAALGAEAGELPVFAPDDGGQGGGAVEAWCPQCFKYHRIPMEGSRLSAMMIDAIHCRACGLKSAEVGRGTCNQCGSANVLQLGPKPNTAPAPASPAEAA